MKIFMKNILKIRYIKLAVTALIILALLVPLNAVFNAAPAKAVGNYFYLDYALGTAANDTSEATPLGWWKVAFDNGTGNAPTADDTITGATSTHHGHLTVVGTITGSWAGNNAAGFLYFYGMDALLHTGEQIDWHDGHGHTTAGAVYCAWKTITSGALATRIAPADVIRIAKSPAPSGMGNATWTSLSKTVTLTAQTGCTFTSSGGTVVLVTKVAHNFTTGDVVTVSATEGGTYDGTYAIVVVSSSTYTLTGTTYSADKTGTVTPAFTKVVDLCETAWTGNGAGDILTPVKYTTFRKENTACMQFTTDAAVQTSIMEAYYATGTLDLSLYQKLTFWIRNSAAIAVDSWEIKLCSDVAGATEVDNFSIPDIPSVDRWIPLTIARDGGGNLGASIKSVALWSHTTAPAASKIVYLDNIIACTTNGLNLQSLISKNALEQSSTASVNASEGWYGIGSINGNTILLDNDTNNITPTAGRGYSTTSTSPETVATYRRETIKTAMAGTTSIQVQALQVSGTLALGNIQYQGGYNTSTNQQTGDSFFDGLNGNGYGIYSNSKMFNTLNYLAFVRYYYGLYYDSSNNTFTTITNLNNNAYVGIGFVSSYNNIITTIINSNNNNVNGIYFSASNGGDFTTITNLNNNLSQGISFSSSLDNTITTITNSNNNGNYGVRFEKSSNNYINTLSAINNATAAIYTNAGKNYFNSSTMEGTEVTTSAWMDGTIFSQKHDGSEGNNWIFTDGGTINSLSSSGFATGSGLMWKYMITSSNRASNYKLSQRVATIACTGGKEVTVTCQAKMDATTVNCQLRCPIQTGVAAEWTDPKTTTAEETLSIAFTPSIACVVEIYFDVWYVSGNSNAYIENMTIAEAS